MKRCVICDELKPLSEYHKASDRVDGHRGDCKTCRKNGSKLNLKPEKLRCTKCGELKDRNEENYYPSKNKFGFRRQCKECHSKQMAECRLKKRYNINHEIYNEMLEKQNGKCLICEKEDKLVVDHDHATGEVRGLLCDVCNRGIGYLQEKNENLWNSILYLNSGLTEKKWVEILKIL